MNTPHILALLMLALLEGAVAILTQKQQTLHFLQRYGDTIWLIQQDGAASSDQQVQVQSTDDAQSSEIVVDVVPEENAQALQETQAVEQVTETPAQEVVQSTEQTLPQENPQATEPVQDVNQIGEEVSQAPAQEIIPATETLPQETTIPSEEIATTPVQDPSQITEQSTDTLTQQTELADQALSSDIPLSVEQSPDALTEASQLDNSIDQSVVADQTVDNIVAEQNVQDVIVADQQSDSGQCQQIIIQHVDNDTAKVEDLDALYEKIEETLNETFSEYSEFQLEIIQQIEVQLDEIQSQTNADTVIILKALLQDKQLQLEDVNADLVKWNSQYGIQCLDYTDCTNCLIKSKCVWCADAEICMDVERAELCVVKYKKIDQCPASFSVEVSTEEQLINYDDDEIFGRNQDKLTLDDDMQRQIAGSVEKEMPMTDEDRLLHKKVEIEEYIIILQDIIDEKEAEMKY